MARVTLSRDFAATALYGLAGVAGAIKGEASVEMVTIA